RKGGGPGRGRPAGGPRHDRDAAKMTLAGGPKPGRTLPCPILDPPVPGAPRGSGGADDLVGAGFVDGHGGEGDEPHAHVVGAEGAGHDRDAAKRTVAGAPNPGRTLPGPILDPPVPGAPRGSGGADDLVGAGFVDGHGGEGDEPHAHVVGAEGAAVVPRAVPFG